MRLRTERLELEPVTDEHLPLLVELNADPEVRAFILGAATPDGAFVGCRSASSFAGRPQISGVGLRHLAPDLEESIPGSEQGEVGYTISRGGRDTSS